MPPSPPPERTARPGGSQTRAGHPHPRPQGAPPAPGGVGHGRCLGVPLQLSAQTWACSAGAAGVPAPQPLSSQPGTYPAAAAAAPCLQCAGLRGRESERETAPAAAWPVPAPRPPSPLQAGARRLRGATRLGPDRARRASGPRAGAASKGNSTPFQPPAPPAGPAPATPPQATPAGPRSLQVPRPPRPPRFPVALSKFYLFFASPTAPPSCFQHNNVWHIFPGGFTSNGQC